jgi:hypothetical protein
MHKPNIRLTLPVLAFMLLFPVWLTAQGISFSLGYNAAKMFRRDAFFDLVRYENKVYNDMDFEMPQLMHGLTAGLMISTNKNLNFEFSFTRKASISSMGIFGNRYGSYLCRMRRVLGTGSMGISFFENPRIGVSWDFGLYRVRWKRFDTTDGQDGWGKLFNAPDVKNGVSVYVAYRLLFVEIKPFAQFMSPAQMLLNDGTQSHTFSAANYGVSLSLFIQKEM